MYKQYQILRWTIDKPLAIILGLFLILSLIYVWATPPLEASDEIWHFGMINFIADTGGLPIQTPGISTSYEQEGSQPPLYYVVSALLVLSIDRSDFDLVREPNPHTMAGVPGNVGNKNLVLRDTPHPFLHNTALAVYIVRLFSIVCSCITIMAIYYAARQLGIAQPLLPPLAASLTAFNPMFLFISSSVNNDNLVTALNSLITWQMLVLVTNAKFTTRQSFFLAVLLALATLSKLSGLVLMVFVLLAGGVVFIRSHFIELLNNNSRSMKLHWKGFGTFLILIISIWLLVAGWWYVRNLILYGELFGTRTMVAVAGSRIGGFSLQTLVDEFQGFRFSYWALFGAVNIMTFRWYYDLMDMVTVLMLIGLLTAVIVSWFSRSSASRLPKNSIWLDVGISVVLLVLIVMVGMISVAVWTSQTYASQGRLLFPFNAAISILGATGLIYFSRYWIKPFLRNQRIIQPVKKWLSAVYVLPAALGSFSLIVVFANIVPEYAVPQTLDRLPDSAHSVYARYGDVALIGYETTDQRYFPGSTVPIRVYWQVLNRSVQNYSLYLHATLDDGMVIGKVDSYPGGGRLRTSTWQPNAIYADTYAIPLDRMVNAVSNLRVQVGWWDYDAKMLVSGTDQNGEPLKSVMLDVGGFAPANISESYQNLTSLDLISFGNAIALTAYRLEGQVLSLSWESRAILPSNYTIFVQALDRNNEIVAQGDAPPTLPTRYWQVGEHFVTHHTIASSEPIAAGIYDIILGWYNPSDSTRLSTTYPDNVFKLPIVLTIP